MSGESVTETDIDEQTKAELQPPCGSRIVLSATGDVLSRCDRPARWVMRIKCPTDTGSGQQTMTRRYSSDAEVDARINEIETHAYTRADEDAAIARDEQRFERARVRRVVRRLVRRTGEPMSEPTVITDPWANDWRERAGRILSSTRHSTFARLLTEQRHVPVKARRDQRRNRKPTRAMNLGKAAHAHALGAGPQLIVWEHDGRTKDGKAERAAIADLLATEAAVAVTEAERDQILGMATALRV
jgi:hypothetical protein